MEILVVGLIFMVLVLGVLVIIIYMFLWFIALMCGLKLIVGIFFVFLLFNWLIIGWFIIFIWLIVGEIKKFV